MDLFDGIAHQLICVAKYVQYVVIVGIASGQRTLQASAQIIRTNSVEQNSISDGSKQ